MPKLDLSDYEARLTRFEQFNNLLKPADPLFEKVAREGNWNLRINSHRSPSRDIDKKTPSGMTQLMLGLWLEQVWYKVDLDFDTPEKLDTVLTYNFGVAVGSVRDSPLCFGGKLELVKQERLSDILPRLDKLMSEGLAILHNFVEPDMGKPIEG